MSRAAFWRTYILMLILVPVAIYWFNTRPAFKQDSCIMLKQVTDRSTFSGFCYGKTMSSGVHHMSCEHRWCYFVTDITCFDSRQASVKLDTDGPSILLDEDLIEPSTVCGDEVSDNDAVLPLNVTGVY